MLLLDFLRAGLILFCLGWDRLMFRVNEVWLGWFCWIVEGDWRDRGKLESVTLDLREDAGLRGCKRDLQL